MNFDYNFQDKYKGEKQAGLKLSHHLFYEAFG